MKPVRHASLLLVLIVALSGASCKTNETPIPVTGVYRLKSIVLADAQPAVIKEAPESYPITLILDQFGIATVESYCNTGSGYYSCDDDDDGLFEIINLTMTEKHCQIDDPLDWEAIFVYNLRLAEEFDLTGDELTIFSSGEYHLNLMRNQ
jgi:heat shock protein HslJ